MRFPLEADSGPTIARPRPFPGMASMYRNPAGKSDGSSNMLVVSLPPTDPTNSDLPFTIVRSSIDCVFRFSTCRTTVRAASTGSSTSPADEPCEYPAHPAPSTAAVATARNKRTLNILPSPPVIRHHEARTVPHTASSQVLEDVELRMAHEIDIAVRPARRETSLPKHTPVPACAALPP